MVGGQKLRGKVLYDALIRIKPDGLAETDWAVLSGLNRGWFSNLKGSDTRSPRMENVEKLLAYIGKSYDELSNLDALPAPNARVIPMEGASLERPQENLEGWGSGLGVAQEFDGEAVELTRLNTGDIVEYVRRPTILNGKKGVYALYVQGSSMHPALPDGEMIVAAREMPMGIGDNVVVYLRPDNPEDDDGESSRGVLVKELVRRSANYVELRQYQPAKDFRVPMEQVVRIDRVLTRREMLS